MAFFAIFPDQSQCRRLYRDGVDEWLQARCAFDAETRPSMDAVKRDFQLALDFLIDYDGVKMTFDAYRRDLERLFLWCWHIGGISVCELDRGRLRAFLEFVRAPPRTWIQSSQQRRVLASGEPNPQWRPFWVRTRKGAFRRGYTREAGSYRPSDAMMRALLASLSTFYNHLVREEVLTTNPVAQLRQKQRYTGVRGERMVRSLSDLQIRHCMDTAEALARDNPDRHERTLFVMHLLYRLYLRISELVPSTRETPLMADFRRDRDGYWFFEVKEGKGRKQRLVSVADRDLAALTRYRRYLGLEPTPQPGETTPLVPSLRGNGPVRNTRQIRRVVQECFDHAAASLRETGLEQDAAALSAATAHWLRHTGISDEARYRPFTHVSHEAGHASFDTTRIYYHDSRQARHRSKQQQPVDD